MPMLHRNRFLIWPTALLLLAVLGGCASGGGSSTSAIPPSVGPSASTELAKKRVKKPIAQVRQTVPKNWPRLDVVVPIFDPNLPKNPDKWKKKGIFPELRRTEANRFALKLKAALEKTNAFGTVRLTPSANATGDLYVSGKILKSNGEDVKIRVVVRDISGKTWMQKTFKHRVKEVFYSDARNKGKDAYTPIFEQAATAIVAALLRQNPERLAKLPQLTELRFGASLSAESFARYLQVEGKGKVKMLAAPAADDPMLERIRTLRVRDQLFIDDMQTYYADFDERLNRSYEVWQSQSFQESKAARKAKGRSLLTGILGGIVAVAGAAAAIDSSSGGYDPNFGQYVTGMVALVVGGALLDDSAQAGAEARTHRETLQELGKSLDIALAPQVVEYEKEVSKLTGDAAEQHRQWIAFLKKIYQLEAVPRKPL